MQNAKIEFPQLFSQESPLETKKIQLLVRLDLYFSSKAKALGPLKNVLRICDSCKKTKKNLKTILILHNSMILSLQSTVIRIGKIQT